MNHIQRDPQRIAPITPTQARFIRLGPAGRWAQHCFETQTIRFGDPSEPHDLCLAGDWDGVADRLRIAGRTASDAGNALREFRDF